MSEAGSSKSLSVLLGALRQERRDGELVLTQNDGVRKLYLRTGELVHLNSEVAGERFGSYLLRQGILDFPELTRILAGDGRFRLGERIVQWGLMTLDERDSHLKLLQEQVMVHALEHRIISLAWNPGSLRQKLSDDLHLKLDHRHFIWKTFQEAQNPQEMVAMLCTRTDWRWEGIPGLLDAVSDLPLNPASAFALSFLGFEPISFETVLALGSLKEDDAARILFSLWAVGALSLVQGELPSPTFMPPEPSAPPPPARV